MDLVSVLSGLLYRNEWSSINGIFNGELVYELNKPGPSTYTPSKPKKEYNSYESSGSSSSYNDGYNSAVDDGDYDHDRYHTDPSYRQGVDDGFDETGEDY